MKYKVHGTTRQKKAIKEILNGKTLGESMIASGYSESMSKTPKKLTESKGYKELMDEIIPDRFLTKKHKELLSTPIKVKTFRKGLDIVEIEMLDTFAISKGLDMAYKIKGHYAAEKREHSGEIKMTPIYGGKSNIPRQPSNSKDIPADEED